MHTLRLEPTLGFRELLIPSNLITKNQHNKRVILYIHLIISFEFYIVNINLLFSQ